MNANPSPGSRAGQVASVVVAALFGLVGLGAAVAMVVTGGGAEGGRATAPAVAEAVVAAWAAGDGDRAVGLMPSYDELAAALDCPRVDDDDGRLDHQRRRAGVWGRAQVWKPRRPRLRLIQPGELQVTEVDAELGSCRTARRFARQRLDLTVELDGHGHGAHEVSITAVQLGTRWYLMDAGDVPPGLDDELARVLAARARRVERHQHADRDALVIDDADDADDDGDERDDRNASLWAAIGGTPSRSVATLRRLRDAACACKDRGCADGVQAELERFVTGHDPAQESSAANQAGSKLAAELSTCLSKVRAADRMHTGVPACDDYVAIIEWYMKCDAIPQAARDGMQQGLDAMKAGWADAASLPDTVRQQMGDSCRAAVDAMRQAGDAMGCGPLPP